MLIVMVIESQIIFKTLRGLFMIKGNCKEISIQTADMYE